MQRFEAISTLTGAEVIDSITGHPVEGAPTRRAAERRARYLNRVLGDALTRRAAANFLEAAFAPDEA